MENFRDVVLKRRTIRRFKQKEIAMDTLKELVDYARLAPMGKNVQPVEFIIVRRQEIREMVFPLLGWAANLPKEQQNPEEGRTPMAYIVVLVNKNIKSVGGAECDLAAAVENMLLGATSFGIGTCWQRNVKKPKLAEILEIPDNYFIHSLVSIGYPDEEAVVEVIDGEKYAYWKDDEGRMHVPKRQLSDVIFRQYD